MKAGVAITGAASGLCLLAFDQSTKAVIFEAAAPGAEIVVAPVLSISPGFNAGIAFGMASGAAPWALIVVGLALSAGLTWLLARSGSRAAGAVLGAVVGGALGNLADRLRFGAVRDFIDVHWGSLHWPAFNIAAAGVVMGLLLFVLLAERNVEAGGRKSRVARARVEGGNG